MWYNCLAGLFKAFSTLKGGEEMNVKRFLKVAVIGMILIVSIWILAMGVRARTKLWMYEISEQTAMAYNQLCVVDGEHLYSLAGWVPAPKYRERLVAAGINVEDYVTMYEQLSYEKLVACSDAPIPVVKDDKNLVHYYSTEESIVSFRKASPAGMDGERRAFSIDSEQEYVFHAEVGPEGYGVYDLFELEDGLYYVNSGGLVELRRSK